MKIIYEENSELREIEFDATVSEKHEHIAEITVHPVESFTDHVRAMPVRLSAEVHVSNTPIRGATKQLRLTTETSRLAVGALPFKKARWENQKAEVNANTVQFDEPEDRVASVDRTLRELLSRGAELTVVTSMGTYESMVISSVGTPRDVKSNAVVFALEMQQIFVASTSTVDAPEPLEPRARRRQDAGAQSPQEEPLQSAWSRLGDRAREALAF